MTTPISFYTTFVSLETLLKREISRFLRIWSQTLLPPGITMALYFIIFGKFIGSQIQMVEGYTYIQFIAPGLIMMSIITNAYSNTASSFFLTKFNKSIEEMIVSPMPNYIILLGFMLGGTIRGLLVGLIVTIIAMFFTTLPLYNLGMVVLMATLSAMIFSLGGIINGIYAKKFDDISFIPTFVLTPLTYLGGVFYSVKQLSPFWQSVSLFNPVLNIVSTFRYGLLGVADFTVLGSFILVIGLLIALFGWGWLLLHRGIGIKV